MSDDKSIPMEKQKSEIRVPIPDAENQDQEMAAKLISSIPEYDDNFTIEKIIQKILKEDKQYDLSKIISAYEFAEKAHRGQFRSSGQPYIIHPLAVAYILLEFSMDTDTICAALLHDVVEDTPATLDDLKKHFGQDVAMLVDGVTKLSKVPTNTKEQQTAENVRKILIAMYQDIRVIIIKLGDRLHNIRTLKFRPRHKQISTAIETMNIYAPIAHRLGIRSMKEELEDLSFRYLDPYAYADIEGILESRKEEREKFIETIKTRISERFSTIKFENPPKIEGRVKSIYSIYKKIFVLGKNMDEIYDKYAVRIIVSSVSECYSVLGLVHDMFRPIPNRFKDYISAPKNNMYSSLHTTVIGEEGIPFEIQIRTFEMHETAEYGIAAHWKYKEGIKVRDGSDVRVAWIRQLLEEQQSADDVEEIVTAIKNDISPEEIVVMTPKGKAIQLPVKSTCIDFAYRIHTEIGHKTIGAKVDGRIVQLNYELETGQKCEILTSKDPDKGPNRAWLEIAKTTDARSKIRSWFKRERRDENIAEGKIILQKAFKRSDIQIDESKYEEFLGDTFSHHNCANLDDFFASVGYGGITLEKIIPQLKNKYDKMVSESEKSDEIQLVAPQRSKAGIVLDSIRGINTKYAGCCNPIPGEEIVGFVTRGFGLTVHTKTCTNYISALQRNNAEELARWCEVEWSGIEHCVVQTTISITSTDRVGLLYDASAVLAEGKIPILHSSSRNLKNGNAFLEFTIEIKGPAQLDSIMTKLKKIKNVIAVERGNNQK